MLAALLVVSGCYHTKEQVSSLYQAFSNLQPGEPILWHDILHHFSGSVCYPRRNVPFGAIFVTDQGVYYFRGDPGKNGNEFGPEKITKINQRKWIYEDIEEVLIVNGPGLWSCVSIVVIGAIQQNFSLSLQRKKRKELYSLINERI